MLVTQIDQEILSPTSMNPIETSVISKPLAYLKCIPCSPLRTHCSDLDRYLVETKFERNGTMVLFSSTNHFIIFAFH